MIVASVLVIGINGLMVDDNLPTIFESSMYIILIIILIYCIISPPLYYKHYRYNLDSEKIDTISGVFFIKHTFVPIERVMQVEIVHGPINRIWGLSEVTVTTSGGTASIRFLRPEESEFIAEQLGRIVNRILRIRDGNE